MRNLGSLRLRRGVLPSAVAKIEVLCGSFNGRYENLVLIVRGGLEEASFKLALGVRFVAIAVRARIGRAVRFFVVVVRVVVVDLVMMGRSESRAERGQVVDGLRTDPFGLSMKLGQVVSSRKIAGVLTGADSSTRSSLLARRVPSRSSKHRWSTARRRPRSEAERAVGEEEEIDALAGMNPTWTWTEPETAEREREERMGCQMGCCDGDQP